MLYLITRVLNETQVAEVVQKVMISDKWRDGNRSANYRSDDTKRNLQLPGSSEVNAQSIVVNSLAQNKAIKNFGFIKTIHSLMFTRTGEGMFYNEHLDKPTLPTGRRDLSFTLFLSNPKSYEGGELVLRIPPETKIVKLKPGEIILYPTQYLHEVKMVNRGERLVSVGWIESDIPEHENRYILGLINKVQGKMQRENDEGSDNQESINSLKIAYNMLYKRYLG